jgi:hypothetical protein
MPAWMTTFLNNFFSTGSKRDTGVSDQAFQANWNLAITASGTAQEVNDALLRFLSVNAEALAG